MFIQINYHTVLINNNDKSPNIYITTIYSMQPLVSQHARLKNKFTANAEVKSKFNVLQFF